MAYEILVQRIQRALDETRSARTLTREHYQDGPHRLALLAAHSSMEAAEAALSAAKQLAHMAHNQEEHGDERAGNKPSGVQDPYSLRKPPAV